MYEDYDELDEMETENVMSYEEVQEELEEDKEQTEEEEGPDKQKEGLGESEESQEAVFHTKSSLTFGGACDESFWKARAAEYYAEGNMAKYKECMEKAAEAAIS